MYLASEPATEWWPQTTRGLLQFIAAVALLWAVGAALLFLQGVDSFPRLLVFSECQGLTMLASVMLLRRWLLLRRLPAGARWLLIAALSIPAGYLLGHQLAFLLLGEPMRLLGFHHISLGPLLLVVLVGALGLRHFAIRTQLAREAAARAEAQLRLLRAQLEPHMLFNTLANLRGLLREDIDRAEAMIDQLIVYLRGTLTASQAESVPLGREFAQLRAYLEIMALRMGPRLRWRLDLPDELEAWPLPPMLLQPLVENAIKHGLEPKIGPGQLDVVARRSSTGLDITIEDDGLGLGDAAAQDPGHYGLRHVRERLATVYGPAAQLRLEARIPSGVRCRVLLPATPPRAS